MLLAEDDIELDDSGINDVGLIQALSFVNRQSKVCIEASPRRIYYRTTQNLEDSNFCAHRTQDHTNCERWGLTKTRSTKLVITKTSSSTQSEVLARHEDIGSDRGFSSKGYEDQVRNILVTEGILCLMSKVQGRQTTQSYGG